MRHAVLLLSLGLIVSGCVPTADFVDLRDEVRVMAEGGPTWREMSRRAAELAHPYASSDIARECLLLAARYRASAQASR